MMPESRWTRPVLAEEAGRGRPKMMILAAFEVCQIDPFMYTSSPCNRSSAVFALAQLDVGREPRWAQLSVGPKSAVYYEGRKMRRFPKVGHVQDGGCFVASTCCRDTAKAVAGQADSALITLQTYLVML